MAREVAANRLEKSPLHLLHRAGQCAEETFQLELGLGDITAPVLDLFYSRFPQTRQRFEELNPGGRWQIEGEMVEQALYCLMTLYDCPGEVEDRTRIVVRGREHPSPATVTTEE